MRILSVIAEYNPFHKGHQYQLCHMKEQLHADYCLVVMSGDFVQRGAPAIIDKYTRAHMALNCGADLVLQLPCAFSTASAEGFALGGIQLINALPFVTDLVYGCESEDVDSLHQLAAFFLSPPEKFHTDLKTELSRGLSFPAARALTASQLLTPADTAKRNQLISLMEAPNNALAIEYEKAILHTNSSLTTHPHLRKNSGHHDTAPVQSFASASHIRKLLTQDCSVYDLIPEENTSILKKNPGFLCEDDFSQFLLSALLLHKEHYTDFLDCSPILANRINNQLDQFHSFTQFCHLLSTKETTYTRISRVMTHIMLQIPSLRQETVPYARVLGFRKQAGVLLSLMAAEAKIPLLMSLSKEEKNLPQSALQNLKQDLYARDLYRHVFHQKNGIMLANEYQQPPISL